MYANDSARTRIVKRPRKVAADAVGHYAARQGFTGEAMMTVLLVAFGTLAAIWLVVLIGAPMFGSDH